MNVLQLISVLENNLISKSLRLFYNPLMTGSKPSDTLWDINIHLPSPNETALFLDRKSRNFLPPSFFFSSIRINKNDSTREGVGPQRGSTVYTFNKNKLCAIPDGHSTQFLIVAELWKAVSPGRWVTAMVSFFVGGEGTVLLRTCRLAIV